MNVDYKIGNIKKTKNRTKKTLELKIRFRTFRIFPVNFLTQLKIVNTINHKSKNKNQKINFSFGSAQWTSFMEI